MALRLRSVQTRLGRHRMPKLSWSSTRLITAYVANLKEIVELVHSYDVPVLVDEAHGVLIHFHEKLPMSAMQAGADMAATSVHKLGGSMTQSSVLNVREETELIRSAYRRLSVC